MNTRTRDGDCDDCGRYWTANGGGIDNNGQCPECRKRYPLAGCEGNDYEMPHHIESDLAMAGAGLGV
ncbi:hypothetical protein [Mariprofundus ferrooxydans]|uniref:hypothetical protein n=1 Tax=Mariprofundus ferrooxydans TaxID=314344 RepID=UPI001430BD09|nr:hypothetical protein [Mariprofundus ferrooxydans]